MILAFQAHFGKSNTVHHNTSRKKVLVHTMCAPCSVVWDACVEGCAGRVVSPVFFSVVKARTASGGGWEMIGE